MEDRPHRLIAITPEDPVELEGDKISALLTAGWFRVHLRHPGASRNEIRHIIESIPQELHSHIVLHGHFDLINEFNLGGLHLNRRCPSAPRQYNGALSRSCHSIPELADCPPGMYEYVTLSPVFDSISKSSYPSAFSREQLLMLDRVATPVIALGGISPDNISQLSPYNFSGYAMLGAIPWSASPDDIFNFANKYKRFSIC